MTVLNAVIPQYSAFFFNRNHGTTMLSYKTMLKAERITRIISITRRCLIILYSVVIAHYDAENYMGWNTHHKMTHCRSCAESV